VATLVPLAVAKARSVGAASSFQTRGACDASIADLGLGTDQPAGFFPVLPHAVSVLRSEIL
jgi:hypothetical protein